MWSLFAQCFSTCKRPKASHITKRAARQARPMLTVEALEDRTVLSGSPIGDLVIFGDSLADVGNLSLASGGAYPNSLYFQGRFSEGTLWVDTLAEYLGEPAVLPSLIPGGHNYSFAGARVTGASPYGVPDVGQQI